MNVARVCAVGSGALRYLAYNGVTSRQTFYFELFPFPQNTSLGLNQVFGNICGIGLFQVTHLIASGWRSGDNKLYVVGSVLIGVGPRARENLTMPVRTPVVAGQFYPVSREQCQAELAEYATVSVSTQEAGTAADRDRVEPAGRIDRPVGGIVPHAGWACSGSVAACVIRELARDPALETFVVFGAVHRVSGIQASVFGRGSWRTPLGDIEIDEALASAVVSASPLIVADPDAHRLEHSIEVQVPFIRHFRSSVKLLPIMVPPSASSHEVGRIVGQKSRELGRVAAFLGSTDLTHYGPRYGFVPHGVGPAALKWAKDVNDRRLLEIVLDLQADRVVYEAERHHNACGSGAVAAAISACREKGASRALLLQHTTSYEVLRARMGEMDDAVGYAGVIFG